MVLSGTIFVDGVENKPEAQDLKGKESEFAV